MGVGVGVRVRVRAKAAPNRHLTSPLHHLTTLPPPPTILHHPPPPTTTHPELQGKGYASFLLELVKRIAARYHANCYVLALEDSCVYWMSKGFELESGR